MIRRIAALVNELQPYPDNAGASLLHGGNRNGVPPHEIGIPSRNGVGTFPGSVAFELLETRRMDRIRTTSLVCALATVLPVCLVALGGCEDNAESRLAVAPANVTALTLVPATAIISSSNTIAVFKASGGIPPYKWSVSDDSLGSVPDTGVADITYTRSSGAVGVNVVTVVDSNLWHAESVIYQK